MAASTVAFDETKFTELLNGEQAWKLWHHRATMCPCRSTTNGSPSKSCTHCNGLGHVWSNPQSVQETAAYWSGSSKGLVLPRHVQQADIVSVLDNNAQSYALNVKTLAVTPTPASGLRITVTYNTKAYVTGSITGLQGNKQWIEAGTLDPRDLQLTVDRFLGDNTPNSAWKLSNFDRFVVLDAEMPMQEIRRRGDDKLIYSHVYEVSRVYSLNSSYQAVEYLEGVDFTLSGNQITWLPNRGPNGSYAISYYAAPEFFVHTMLTHMRHQGGKPLPRRCVLKLWELYSR